MRKLYVFYAAYVVVLWYALVKSLEQARYEAEQREFARRLEELVGVESGFCFELNTN